MTIHRQPRSLTGTTPWPAGTGGELCAAIAGIPELLDAACKGRPEDFDLTSGDDPDRIKAAKHVCQQCPALQRCREWVKATPESRRPSGVVAGRLLAPPQIKPLPPPRQPKPPRPSMADAATGWLAGYLADGELPAADIKQAARAAGFGKNAVHVAANRLNVQRHKISRREVSWALPCEARSA